MKLGVHIGYWGLGLTSEDQLAIVQEAERLGYDSRLGRGGLRVGRRDDPRVARRADVDDQARLGASSRCPGARPR